MQNIVDQPLGGGGRLSHRARSKMEEYCKRYHKCKPAELPRIKKLPFVRLLADVYNFSAKEIAAFFDCDLSTAYRMITDARFWQKRSKLHNEQEQRIANYILYNAQWRGGVSIT